MTTRISSSLLRVHPVVQAALAARKPVVALESTIITHGLPFPDNFDAAIAIEKSIRDQGAIPATTAFIDGIAYVGLEEKQLERLAENAKFATKTSRRDISQIILEGKGSIGATTVSATMILAHSVGIPIFATGGIGGVHRNGHISFDISADLTELSRTPVAVFCSGAKSILDIGRTLEYLETMGVSVNSFHPQGDFPAFYSPSSNYKVTKISSIQNAAQLINSQRSFNLQSGMVFGIPIPSEFQSQGENIQEKVEKALEEAKDQGMDKKGKQVTPWLLKRISELSKGNSIKSNKALVMNNAKIAAQVACSLSDILINQDNYEKTSKSLSFNSNEQRIPVIVIGHVALDIVARKFSLKDVDNQVATTYPGNISFMLGGVGGNIALALHYFGIQIKFFSSIGKDEAGELIIKKLQQNGMSINNLLKRNHSSSCILLQLDESGDLQSGIAHVDESRPNGEDVQKFLESIQSGIIAIDANISVEAISQVLRSSSSTVILFEPTSVKKSIKVIKAFLKSSNQVLDITTPNIYELKAMYLYAKELQLLKEDEILTDEVSHQSASLAKLFKGVVMVKLGPNGVFVARWSPSNGKVIVSHHKAKTISKDEIINTTGAGDSFAATIIACIEKILPIYSNKASIITKFDNEEIWSSIVEIAQQAAIFTLRSDQTISKELSKLYINPIG